MKSVTKWSIAQMRFCACWLLGTVLIAAGRVRKARNVLLRTDGVISLYFHKPNKKLFLLCVTWLMKHGFHFISAQQVIEMMHAGKAVPRGAVWLSFDDGCKELLTDVLPTVKALRIPVTLFIPTGIVAGNGLFPWFHDPDYPGSPPVDDYAGSRKLTGGREAMTIADITRIAAMPEVTIGSHTVTHCPTPTCSDERIQWEIRSSKVSLELWTGKAVTCFSYPEGRYDGRERACLVECGQKLAVTTQSALMTSDSDPLLAPRFSCGDNVPFPQAICSMVGVWRPIVDRVRGFLNGFRVVKPLGNGSARVVESSTRAAVGTRG